MIGAAKLLFRKPSASGPLPAAFGYFYGGSTSGSVPTVTADRLTFSTGAVAAFTTGNLAAARVSAAALSDKTTYGYIGGGGTNTASPVTVLTALRITFSTGVPAANTASDLTAARAHLTSVSDGGSFGFGYFLGGESTYNNFDCSAVAWKITFSTGGTAASTTSNLSSVRGDVAGISDGTAFGYVCGGTTNQGHYVALATTDKITFSSGATAASTTSALIDVMSANAALSNPSTYGYYLGGGTYFSPVQLKKTTWRILFSSGVFSANTASDLSTARCRGAGVSDGTTNGYVCGGDTGGAWTVEQCVATGDKLVFSTGVLSANTAGNLSTVRQGVASVADGAV